MEFIPTDPTGIGMEMEFQLIDSQTLDLVDGIQPLMTLVSDNPYVKPEFIQDTVEVASKICYTLPELEEHVKAVVAELKTKCQQLGMTLCSAGTHPFSERLAIFTPLPRYLYLGKKMGYLSRTLITFATHVHIGMNSGEEAVRVMRELKPYLPLLIALSASSPFWRGYDTGYVSYRHRILAATRSYGIPPSFKHWDDFIRFFAITHRAGVFDTINDIHWDIRPRPHLGSLEIRVMDAQPTVADAVALAGLVRTLVAYLRETVEADRPERLPRPLSWWIEKHNHFQASQWGLEAQHISDEEGSLRDLRTVCQDVLEVLAPTATTLGQGQTLDRLQQTLTTGTSCARQRDVYQQAGSLRQVVVALTDELSDELAMRR